MKRIFKNEHFTGERALFSSRSIRVEQSVFDDGESPLKESRDVEVSGCRFGWKYPLWYCCDVAVENTRLEVEARSGIWYTQGISMRDCEIEAPKTFRRSSRIDLDNVRMNNAQETMWGCSDIKLKDVYVRGDYFGLNCDGVFARDLRIDGNYAFDGGKNIEIHGGELISKDAFWNCENVTVYDCLIVGEYLGWNSKNVKFVNCTLESNQGMCYMENLTLENCVLRNTDLAFEYSTVNATILSSVDSIKNPISASIVAEDVGEIILESERIDPAKTKITLGGKNEI